MRTESSVGEVERCRPRRPRWLSARRCSASVARPPSPDVHDVAVARHGRDDAGRVHLADPKVARGRRGTRCRTGRPPGPPGPRRTSPSVAATAVAQRVVSRAAGFDPVPANACMMPLGVDHPPSAPAVEVELARGPDRHPPRLELGRRRRVLRRRLHTAARGFACAGAHTTSGHRPGRSAKIQIAARVGDMNRFPAAVEGHEPDGSR